MTITVIAFTDRGRRLARTICEALSSEDIRIADAGIPLSEICSDAFRNRTALVFIGAAGIAVRSVAPYIKDKFTDPPVIVMDEAGRHVIPILSGHMGGANELALRIADKTGAEAVLTTATDVSRAFSADIFAKENGLRIVNREGIAKVSASALEGKPVTICIRDYPPQDHVDVLVTDDITDSGVMKDIASLILCPKRYAVGIGCRRGRSFEDIRDLAQSVLTEHGIDIDDVGAIATIDLKKDEPGLIRLSEYWRVPLLTFEASVLARVPGEFSSSQRVLDVTGVDNVCERAAAAAAGPGSDLVIRKTASDGITIAAAIKRSQQKGK